MNGDIDAWLNEGLAEEVAKSTGQPPPQVVNPNAKGLQKFGIGRGGVIRNPNTKVVTMTSNPVANPKPSKINAKAVKAPTPEEDFKAEHPALAIPTVMTGMDMDTQKRNGTAEAKALANPIPAPVAQPGQPVPVTYQSTLKDLLLLAVSSGGILHFGTGEFVLSIQILKNQA